MHQATTADECEDLFQSTTSRLPDGRYVVQIPFKNHAEIGFSHQLARRQFNALERRFASNPDLRHKYVEFMREYIRLGHMSPVGPATPDGYYIPHHAVDPKFRVVFNASAETTTGQSLNDIQHKGSRVQDVLVFILMRFRRYPVAVTADVEKMFRQIVVEPEQRKWQKILWREDPDEDLVAYELNTVTYGMASSPFVAVRTLKQCALDNRGSISDQSRADAALRYILNSFYVDDLLTSFDTAEEAVQASQDIDSVLQQGKFQLRKWNSNDRRTVDILCKNPPSENQSSITSDETSVLGIQWNPVTDDLFYKLTLGAIATVMTKKIALNEISTLFDPLGLLAPILIRGRILVQELWKANLQWDEPLPEHLYNDYGDFRAALFSVDQITVPRWMGCRGQSQITLHGFCDASKKAYAAVIYCKSVSAEGEVQIQLITSKARVAPVKEMTIPRLELCSAQLLVETLKNVRAALDIPDVEYHLYTDSTIALPWIRQAPSEWKQYVANRVAFIQQHTTPSAWRHIRTAENPADIASRGTTPAILKDHRLWWDGPQCIRYPPKDEETPELTEEEAECSAVEARPVPIRVNLATNPTGLTTRTVDGRVIRLIDRFSSLHRLVHTTAMLRRWIRIHKEQRGSVISPVEYQQALRILIHQEQELHFSAELKLIREERGSEIKNPLSAFSPFIDPEGILRVGGRLGNSELLYGQKHPVIISKDSRLAELLISNAHATTMHGGIREVLQYLRQEFWIINGRALVKSAINKCTTCKRYVHKLCGGLRRPILGATWEVEEYFHEMLRRSVCLPQHQGGTHRTRRRPVIPGLPRNIRQVCQPKGIMQNDAQ